MKRRDVVVLSAIVAGTYGLRALPWEHLPGRGPRYVDIQELPPFRRLEEIGQVSGATPFVGLDPADEDADQRRARASVVRGNLCTALFGPSVPTQTVPIAYFSEFRCPYCRQLERDLDTLMQGDAALFRLIQHELPIFGPASELAARASVAAARQGKQQELRHRFMRASLVAEPASVLRVAAELGLDVKQLEQDMGSKEVQAELFRSRAIADLFGFIGTPGIVIGRTVFNGAVPIELLRRIVEDEKSRGGPVC